MPLLSGLKGEMLIFDTLNSSATKSLSNSATNRMRKIELLAPAGDLEKLKIAVEYGADAVYFGGEMFSLRSGAGNMTVPEIREEMRNLEGDPQRNAQRRQLRKEIVGKRIEAPGRTPSARVEK